MPCFHPLHAYRSVHVNPSGKRGITFKPSEAHRALPVTVPCGQCIGCRLERSRQWAIRCVHEASLYESNSFITLTYSPEYLPPSGSLIKKDFQDFMKRLRKRFPQKIRYYMCGEYGEKLGRPHYHACLFNFDPSDKELWKTTEGGKLYVSETLNEVWGKGYCVVGDVTFDSAAYVARYIVKKITGERSEEHYQGRLPEYNEPSRRPGIGKGWIKKWMSDTYPSDSVIMNGKAVKPPKFYDRTFEVDNPDAFVKIKRVRKAMTPDPNDPEQSYERMSTKELCQQLNLENLKRSYEK